MMETVEDIPREAIMSGLPWDWEPNRAPSQKSQRRLMLLVWLVIVRSVTTSWVIDPLRIRPDEEKEPEIVEISPLGRIALTKPRTDELSEELAVPRPLPSANAGRGCNPRCDGSDC